MSGREIQAVLRCPQCNKPFDKQTTLKRHGYYCRSRKVGSTNRVRSCISCAKGKARCDNKRPDCSRCASKGIQCHYPADSRKEIESRSQNDNSPTEIQIVEPSTATDTSIGFLQNAGQDDDMMLEDVLNMPLANLGDDLFNWNDPDLDFSEFLNTQTITDNVDFSIAGSSLVQRAEPPTFGVSQQFFVSPEFSIPPTPSTYNRRSLVLRTKVKAGAMRAANLILATLKSYPKMMLKEKILPPFIHPHLIPYEGGCDQMEPLTNCISLVHMLSSGMRSSQKLFWKNVRMECERMRAECLQMSKWSLLAAHQALSIYIMVRLCEGENEYNNLDVLLLGTVAIIAKQMICTYIEWTTPSAVSTFGLEFSWKEWLFEESRRRVSVVYRVVNMLVHFEPAKLCEMQTDLVLAPLPAKRQLWEAPDQFSWKTASEKDDGSETLFAMTSNGELVQLEDSTTYCTTTEQLRYRPLADQTSRKSVLWEEWCSSMDGFGGLVMLAASLVE